MIDWQAIAITFAGLLSSWTIYEIKQVKRSLQELSADVSYLKGYQDAQKD